MIKPFDHDEIENKIKKMVLGKAVNKKVA